MNTLNTQVTQYNFTHSFFYDHDLAQMWLDDFNSHEDDKQVVYFGSDNDYVVIFANEKIMNASYYKVSHLRKMTKQQLFDLCEQYEILSYYYSEWYFEDNTKQTLIDELMKYCTNKFYYEYHFNQVSWRNLESDFIIRGNCQGDAKAIKLVSDKQNKFEYNIDRDHLENIYFNTPIHATVDIYNGDELIDKICFSEFVNDVYTIDEDNLLNVIDENFKDHQYYSALKFYVENNFPQYPR